LSVQGATSSAAARRRWFVTVLIALIVVAVAAGIALSRMRGAAAGTGLGSNPAGSTDPSGGAGLGSAPASAEPSDSAQEPGASPHTPKTGGTRKVSASTEPSTEPSTEASTGPVIEHFRVSSKPSCPSGTDQVQYEGQPVTLTWKVSGAEKTTISVDGPGIYDTYGAADSVTLNFPCGGDPGSYQTHTYLLTAICPDGITTTKKLTVKAKVNEIATT
jgi:hypothetical protein